jgi:hypothetical protein
MTWNQTPIETFASGITSLSDFFTKLDAHLTAYSTLWETSVLDPAGTKEYLEIKRQAGVAAVMQNFRMFLCGSTAGSKPPTGNQVFPHSNNNTTTESTVFMCFAPDVGGTFPNTGLDTKWETGYPYAGDANPSQIPYIKASQRLGVDIIFDQMYLLECEDMLFVVLIRRSDQKVAFFGCGGMFLAPTVALGDPIRGDEVVWGMVSTAGRDLGSNGGYNIHAIEGSGTDRNNYTPFNGQLSQNASTQNRQSLCCLLTPIGRTTSTVSGGRVYRIYGTNSYQNEFISGNEDESGYWNTVEYLDGSRACDPIAYQYVDQSNRTRMGELRQIHPVWESLAHKEVRDAAGNLKGYDLCGQTSFAGTSGYFFSNDPNPGP